MTRKTPFKHDAEKSEADIAKELGVSIGYVCQTLKRAMRKLEKSNKLKTLWREA
jgi:DNA-directed RNA polymerase specialized sigma subunit